MNEIRVAPAETANPVDVRPHGGTQRPLECTVDLTIPRIDSPACSLEPVMFSDADPVHVRAETGPNWSDLRFQADLVMALPDAAVATDSDFNVRLVNPAAEALYGIDEAQVTGRSVLTLTETRFGADADSHSSPEMLRQIISRGFWQGHIQQKNAVGHWREMEASASVLHDDVGEVRGVLFIARDVTRLRMAEREASERTEFAAAVLESLPGRTCVVDEVGRVMAVNKRYREEGPSGLGQVTGPQEGDDYLTWVAETVGPEAAKDLRQLIQGDSPDLRIEYASVRRRKRQWSELYAVPLSSERRGAVITHVDITARKQAETALTRRATHDPLTGLPNRVLLNDRLAHALSRGARTKTQIGLLFCDLDGFRDVNNTYGHLAGDKLLVTIAKRLRAVCRSSDTVARVSGDEFVIILEDVASAAEVEEVARRVIEALTEPVVLEEGEARTGTSIGLVITAGVPRAGVRTVENLIRDADAAMYAAKEAGRGRFAWFTPEMREKPRERPTFVQAINRLLNR